MLRPPKGTKDYSPIESITIEFLIDKCISVFKLHNAVPLDTPTMELKSLLTNKYGEDSKLIFDLADQGGDICALRYDLTVSFARYLAMNKIQKIKRYQIGKVFRRDNPSIAQGRLREFVQCDFDIAGSSLVMMSDAEVVLIADKIFKSLNLGEFTIKINHRKILSAIIKSAMIEDHLFSTVCSSIDKLDKMSWKEVSDELKAKGLNEIQIVKLSNLLNSKVDDMIGILKDSEIYSDADGRIGIDEMEVLLQYLKVYDVKTRFDLSLARGLDYYTGMIFEITLNNHKIGSIAGGGRYDKLVSSTIGSGVDVPCVGFSVGVTRLYSLIKIENSQTSVFVGSSGGILTEERMKVLKILWENGIIAETFSTKRFNFNGIMESATKMKANYVLIVGAEEIKNGLVKIIKMDNSNESDVVSLENAIEMIKTTA